MKYHHAGMRRFISLENGKQFCAACRFLSFHLFFSWRTLCRHYQLTHGSPDGLFAVVYGGIRQGFIVFTDFDFFPLGLAALIINVFQRRRAKHLPTKYF